MKISDIIFYILIIWLLVSATAFSIRHPWMTQMEMLINLPKVLTFQKVDYLEFRNQYLDKQR
jgi:hypothetical protein